MRHIPLIAALVVSATAVSAPRPGSPPAPAASAKPSAPAAPPGALARERTSTCRCRGWTASREGLRGELARLPAHESLAALERRLDPRSWVRIHRATLVNLDFVAEVLGGYADARVRLKDAARDRFKALGEALGLR